MSMYCLEDIAYLSALHIELPAYFKSTERLGGKAALSAKVLIRIAVDSSVIPLGGALRCALALG